MKQIIFILALFFPSICFSQNISIEIDTLEISVYGQLTETAVFEDNFYFIFQSKRRNTSGKYKSMKVFDLNGNFIENVFLPLPAISMPYYDLRVNNQRLYLKQESSLSDKTYLLEKYVANFNQISDTLVNIYEDSSFKIYPNCNGEWGASTYFENKLDGKVYEFSSSCTYNFEKANQGYLLTNSSEIVVIENPTELYESQLTFDRSYLDKLNQGVDTLFKSDLDLYTTFEVNNELVVIYGDSIDTYIGKLNDQKLNKIYNFSHPYSFSNWFKDNQSDVQILKMYTYDSITELGGLIGYKMLGLLLINDGKIRLYYIK
jgi:hypothetical protein